LPVIEAEFASTLAVMKRAGNTFVANRAPGLGWRASI
jgi:hypothetical protein